MFEVFTKLVVASYVDDQHKEALHIQDLSPLHVEESILHTSSNWTPVGPALMDVHNEILDRGLTKGTSNYAKNLLKAWGTRCVKIKPRQICSLRHKTM